MTPSQTINRYDKARRIADAFKAAGLRAEAFDQGEVTDQQWSLATQVAGFDSCSQDTKDLVVHLLRDFGFENEVLPPSFHGERT